MSSPPATPAQTTSRRGRILQPTKCKLQAPITTFVKTFKKARTALTPGRRDSAETGLSEPDETGSTSRSVPTPPTAALLGAPPSASARTRIVRASASVVIEDSDDDADHDDQSSNGDVLPLDNDVIMLDAAPTTSTPASSKENGGESSKTGQSENIGA